MQQSIEGNKKDVTTRNQKRSHDCRDGGSTRTGASARNQKEEVSETDSSEDEGDWITEASESSEGEEGETTQGEESEGC